MVQNFWQPKLVVRTVRDYPVFHLETPIQQLPVKKVELNYHFTEVVVLQVVLYYGYIKYSCLSKTLLIKNNQNHEPYFFKIFLHQTWIFTNKKSMCNYIALLEELMIKDLLYNVKLLSML